MGIIDKFSLTPILIVLLALFCLNAFAEKAKTEVEKYPVFKPGFLKDCIKESPTSETLRYCVGTLSLIVIKYVKQSPTNYDCSYLQERITTLKQMNDEYDLIIRRDETLPEYQVPMDRLKWYTEAITAASKSASQDYKSGCTH